MTICVIHSWHFPKHTSQYAFCKLHAAHANRNAVGRARGGSESVPVGVESTTRAQKKAPDVTDEVGQLLVDACM